jgi:DNA-directed RNA polymerase subunit RPC12/RpoP
MNLICIKCGKAFTVEVEQLGTRGKCPHCRATVMIPKLHQTGTNNDIVLASPFRWLDRTYAAVFAVFLHLAIISVIAVWPAVFRDEGLLGAGQDVQIGVLSEQPWQTQPAESSPAEPLSVSVQPQFQSLAPDLTPLSTTDPSQLTASSQVWTPGGSTGQPFNEQVNRSSQLTAGGEDDFGILINRLRADGLDLVITFDSTGSMGGEIAQVKKQIERIGSALIQLIPKTRISICTYRDEGDDFVVRGIPLTNELGPIIQFLDTIAADGGGDEPEAVHAGLEWSIDENQFRRQAKKIILLFGDAPPHQAKRTRCLQLASEFRRSGGVMSTVTCRNKLPLDMFAEIAELGGGEAFLTRDERQIVTQLVVLVFGSQHRDKVVEIFKLLEQ